MEDKLDNLNYIFFEEYKSLNKLCGEIYKNQTGVTCYIDNMKRIPWFEYQAVPNWKSDLQQLIKLRHIRNELAHTEGAFSMKICTQADINWIQNFHKRIMNQSDPLALLYRNTIAKKQQIANQMPQQINDRTNNQSNEKTSNSAEYSSNDDSKIFYCIIIAIIAAITFSAIIIALVMSMMSYVT